MNCFWFLKQFCSRASQACCYRANQPNILNRSTVMKDALSTDSAAPCTMTWWVWHAHIGSCSRSRKTCYFIVPDENLLFGFRNKSNSGRHALSCSNFGVKTGTEPFPCWWKRAMCLSAVWSCMAVYLKLIFRAFLLNTAVCFTWK